MLSLFSAHPISVRIENVFVFADTIFVGSVAVFVGTEKIDEFRIMKYIEIGKSDENIVGGDEEIPDFEPNIFAVQSYCGNFPASFASFRLTVRSFCFIMTKERAGALNFVPNIS